MRTAELQLWEIPKEQWLRSVLVVAIIIFNVADVLTTQAVLARGGVELNPVSALLIEHGILAHAKLGVAAFIGVAAYAASQRRSVSSVLGPVAAFYTAVVLVNSVQLTFA